ncbi:hypothetical protein SAMN05216275_10545 [Streptosporangium canum]|uniref:Uncharacterized protein n=1 Tax=Streptosporangium canum TaxID=324952 RepID=A0A1I3L848_9ACTN|nr:hypothetical protein [Streptosporangium canum]SFI80878.1 hypothetical protein SAMN05216275_10545 [Streptosporangium canum]
MTCDIFMCEDEAAFKTEIRASEWAGTYQICAPHATGERRVAGTILSAEKI